MYADKRTHGDMQIKRDKRTEGQTDRATAIYTARICPYHTLPFMQTRYGTIYR